MIEEEIGSSIFHFRIISDVKQQGGALNIEKKLFVKRISADGQKSLQPLTEVAQLFVGDKIVSRLTVRRPKCALQRVSSQCSMLRPAASHRIWATRIVRRQLPMQCPHPFSLR